MNTARALEQIAKAENILIITHENLDGDALGSTLAFKFVLESLGKIVKTVCVDMVPNTFKFLPDSHKIEHDFLFGDHDVIIILDCGDLKRTGFAFRLKEFSKAKRKIINIDHHPKNDLHRIARFNLVNYEACSASEIVYDLLQEMKIKLDPIVATCLLCGFYTDTGAFQHSNVNSKVLQNAANLMRQGGKLKLITRNISNGRSISALRLWGVVLSRIQNNSSLGLVTSFVTKEDMLLCEASENDLAGAVNIINTISGTNASILFSERGEGLIKASLRTERNNVDLSRLAQIFGGGGLKKASGFTVKGKLIKNQDNWQIVEI